MSCADCKHALPVDPDGHWRTRHNSYADSHIHCGKDEHAYASVIPKANPCQFQPSQWEMK